MSDVIYVRQSAQKYNMLNGFSKADGAGGRFIKQGILVFFEAMSDENLSATYNASRAAKDYVHAEIVSGNVDREDREETEARILKNIMSFIEEHDHYTKEDGRGQNLIWREKSLAEKAVEIKKQAEEMITGANKMLETTTKEDIEQKFEEFKETITPKKKKTLGKPVGIVVGASNAAGGGRG
jgi:hypothetical protein